MTLELKTLPNGKLRFSPVKYCRVVQLHCATRWDWTDTIAKDADSRFLGFVRFNAIALNAA